MKRRLNRWPSILYAGFIYAFLYIPIVILIAFSFNQSRLNAVWTGFTFDWYGALLQNTDVLDATKVSLTVAFISTIASTMIGTLAAVGMYRYHFRGKTALDGMLYLPIVIPEIVMGISLLAFFATVEIPLGITTLVIAHITFSVPFVVVVVRARLEGFDRSIEEAAMDLGANEWQTFVRVTLPIIAPGIVAGALLAFTLSIDDVIISFFVAGPSSTTLPLKIFSMVKFGVTPEINALSTIMLIVTLTIVIIAERIRMKKENVS
ncbi:spermidine/putrescine ABC transporter permease PotC [Novibacillus thermophilus]|uniref:Spermidine/putrescine ABC transporter permease PotC n=1 Tax=Novibacillus thermophilus TaxID=1471761 RepID=A0A1U9K6F3_9BACL|nr:spermidine/putrescine ABC transporter permease PotC [Novibacillus thermophilus]AQS55614.1 spermidine/putrescine ABC transporter permease PotC [Novibacillus thermophilus]